VFEDKALDMQTQKREKALQQLKALISGFPERKKEYLEVLHEFEVKSPNFRIGHWKTCRT
jgi:hypothetical protein